jgi:hypothetical protein
VFSTPQQEKNDMPLMKPFRTLILSALFGISAFSNGTTAQTLSLHTPVLGIQNHQYFIMNYPDEDSTAGVRDFRCRSASYEAHQGTDFGLRDFALMDSGVTVVAAASGTVTAVADGVFDRSKAAVSGGYGNYVAVNSNGYILYYAHLKKNSIRVKKGDVLKIGDTIAQVGSSGKSSDPHLHFEIQKDGIFIDPWAGACNSSPSLWAAQEDYTDTLVMLDAGFLNFTPTVDTLRERPPTVRIFTPDDPSVWFWVHTLSVHAGDTCSAYWYQPDGTEYYHSDYVHTVDFRYSWFWFNIYAVKAMPEGLWKVVYKHNGREIHTGSFTFQSTGVAPKITSSPAALAVADNQYTSRVVASGIPEPSFQLRTKPSGMTIEPFTGSLLWLPTRSQKGMNTVTVRAKNSVGYDDQTFQIDVQTAPVITSIAPKTAHVSQPYQYEIAADAYPAARYALLQAPSSMSIDSIQGTIQWIPAAKDTGQAIFIVQASNNAGTAIQIDTVDVRVETGADHESSMPGFSLDQNYPNPFQTETSLRFSLQNTVSKISLKVFDALGREVETLYEGTAGPGEHEVRFRPSHAQSGVFYYQLRNGLQTVTRMMQHIE